ncbi:hypothetical protein H0484_02975 [Pusillimonas sp. CC-YST705]|uniref:Uncharacterized protein n=1 Tax=Mesopusillimonas faecipullorum TaxID=2755040 RepID=A0ABS8C9K7_9BURK|nr:hypothetical protein [Mesopusillimonas faecipullorum]MCB5362718.1 hypothetical protein [Mesopusillimonas faecipullorum]
MKRRYWLACAGVLFAAAVALKGWFSFTELASNREWQAIPAGPDGTALKGVQVSVQQQTAAITTQRPNYAALFVRLQLNLAPNASQAWQDCRVSLHGEDGQIWRPVTTGDVYGVVKMLARDGKNLGLCNMHSHTEQKEAETRGADQLFLVPVEALDTLHVHVSGLGTRPEAISIPLTPSIRRLP